MSSPSNRYVESAPSSRLQNLFYLTGIALCLTVAGLKLYCFPSATPVSAFRAAAKGLSHDVSQTAESPEKRAPAPETEAKPATPVKSKRCSHASQNE